MLFSAPAINRTLFYFSSQITSMTKSRETGILVGVHQLQSQSERKTVGSRKTVPSSL